MRTSSAQCQRCRSCSRTPHTRSSVRRRRWPPSRGVAALRACSSSRSTRPRLGVTWIDGELEWLSTIEPLWPPAQRCREPTTSAKLRQRLHRLHVAIEGRAVNRRDIYGHHSSPLCSPTDRPHPTPAAQAQAAQESKPTEGIEGPITSSTWTTRRLDADGAEGSSCIKSACAHSCTLQVHDM